MNRYVEIAVYVLIATGIAVSGYLLSLHLSLSGQTVGVDICRAVFGTGCEDALRSSAARLLGIPLAGWGLVYYVTLTGLILLSRFRPAGGDDGPGIAAFLLAIAGACSSAVYLVLIVSGVYPVCPLCVVIHVLNFALVVPVQRRTRCSARKLFRQAWVGVSGYFRDDESASTYGKWNILALFAAALISVLAYQWVLIKDIQSGPPPIDPKRVVADFMREPVVDIPVRDDDAKLGTAAAQTELVIFSDFQCPACRRFRSEMYRQVENYGEEIRIVFKHYPLDSRCNSSMRENLHSAACTAAQAAVAAARQGKFWLYHDLLFEADLDNEETTYREIASTAELNVERFTRDFAAPETVQRIREDIALGNRLKLEGTPSVILNGRNIRSLRPDVLDVLMHEVLHKEEGHEH